MTPLAFSAPGRFWRGNLHTHSNLSDGLLTPEETCRRYREAGYDFVALTDHFVGLFGYPLADAEALSEPGFTTLRGVEIYTGAMENGEIWHILAIGLPAGFAPPDAPDFKPKPGQESAAAAAARAREAGAFIVLAHPGWSGVTRSDALSIEAAHAVEIYNHAIRIYNEDKPDLPWSFECLDDLLRAGRHVFLTAGDDAHFYGADHFGGQVMVKAEENSPEALLAALKSGAFYTTTGPGNRDLRLEGDMLHVESDPACRFIVTGESGADEIRGEALTHAEIPLRNTTNSPWIRLGMECADGGRAWSNPIWRG